MGQREGYKWLSLGRAPAQKGHGVSSDQWGHREEESLPTCPASWPASPGAGLPKKSWGGGVGLLYLCLSDKFKMSPLLTSCPARALRTAGITLHVDLQGTLPAQSSPEVFLHRKPDLPRRLNWSHCQIAWPSSSSAPIWPLTACWVLPPCLGPWGDCSSHQSS